MSHFDVIFLPFLIALLSTVVLTPLALVFLKKFNVYDDPKIHKHPAIQHKKPIPRGGGIPLFFGILIPCLILLPITPVLLAIYTAGFLALAIGILDDKLDTSPYLRFFGNFITAGIVVGSSVTIPFITNPFGGILQLDSISFSFIFFSQHVEISLATVAAMIWIVWVMNMLNWSKGVDGQMPGIVAISAAVIGLLSLRFSLIEQETLTATILSFAIAGSAVGFLFFNFHPAKIFPGYGATAIYLLLSVVSILSGAKLATAILVMGIPMVDGIFTVGRRILTGHSPFWHDNKHLHHILLRFGLGHRQIALFYWSISATLGLIALMLSSKGKIFAIIMLVAIVGGALLFLHILLQKNEKKPV